MSRKPKRKMQPCPRPPMPATTPTVPAVNSPKKFDPDEWIGSGKFAPRCTHDATQIVEIGGVPIYAADGWGSRKAPPGSVVLNCSGSSRIDGATIPPGFNALRAHLDEPDVEEIVLPWDDGGVPPVKATFWRALIELCAARNAPLVIHCIGGHGRTGTALAAILIAYSVSADDAVKFVRKNHCTKAVETIAQERYLDDLDDELNLATPDELDKLDGNE